MHADMACLLFVILQHFFPARLFGASRHCLLISMQARNALRRLYQRRALQSWYQHVLDLQQQRVKVMHVARMLMFGSLVRCFQSWLQYTQVGGYGSDRAQGTSTYACVNSLSTICVLHFGTASVGLLQDS